MQKQPQQLDDGFVIDGQSKRDMIPGVAAEDQLVYLACHKEKAPLWWLTVAGAIFVQGSVLDD